MKLLKPVNAELVIHDPRTRKRVPMEGIVVDERDSFWARRLRENSMTAEEAPPKPVKQAKVLAVEPPALGPGEFAGKTVRVKATEE